MSQYSIDVMREICPEAEDWELIKETALLDVNSEVLYRPFETLSDGEKTKVLLAALFIGSNRFLLIDEPTNHLDAEARKKVGAYLNRKKGFILVSHDRELLDSCIDHVLSINRNNIEVQQGNFSTWSENKRLQDEFELAENEKLQKEIGRLTDAARRTSAWSDRVEKTKNGTRVGGLKVDKGYVGHKAEKMMRRSKSQENRIQAAAEAKSGLLKNIDKSESLKLSPLSYVKNSLVSANELSMYYGDMEVCGNVSFNVQRGERVAVTGKNGCGKSTLLKLILGEKIQHTGTIDIGSNLKISYVPQYTSDLKGSLAEYAKLFDVDESQLMTILRKMGFDRIQFEKDISSYSEGQKKKVLIARSLCEQAHLYVWDEPLNYIDVITRMQIEDLILQYQPTMLFVEHDRVFQERISTKTIML